MFLIVSEPINANRLKGRDCINREIYLPAVARHSSLCSPLEAASEAFQHQLQIIVVSERIKFCSLTHREEREKSGSKSEIAICFPSVNLLF